jgi:hypothetical protein
MLIMDTALFYPSYMNLDARSAHNVVASIISSVNRFGGVLTINWHDRSLAPERLWDRFYDEVLDQLGFLKPWFATALQAVQWFDARRKIELTEVCDDGRTRKIRAAVKVHAPGLPGFRLRVSIKAEPSEINGQVRSPIVVSEQQLEWGDEMSAAA